MKILKQQGFMAAAIIAAFIFGVLGSQMARAGASITMVYPLSATPGDTLSVTSIVVNTGATLSQLQVSEILPGGTTYQYVSNSLQVSVAGAAAITNASSLLTINGGTNLVINLNNIQTTNGPTNLVLSEVFPGASASQSWFEIFNPTASAISTAGWSVQDDRPGVVEPLPAYTVQPGQFVVVVPNTNTFLAAHSGFTNVLLQVTNNFYYSGLTYGLNQFADGLSLVNSNSVVVDDLSWGYDTSLFNPAVPYPSTTQSLERYPANVETHTANDWIVQTTPDPGTGTVISGVASGGTINISYQLTAECGGVGGYLNASATYQQPPGSATQTNSAVDFIAFQNPVLLVSKLPQEQQATKGNLVVWTNTLYNSGFGVAHNSVLYDSIASGLTFVGFSIPPTTPNPTATNAVYWDTSAIPALAGLTNGGPPVSIVVTALVSTCGVNLNNRADASFGLSSSNLCQDTRMASNGTESAIEFYVVIPSVSFYLTPTNTPVLYCSGTNITLSVTNFSAPGVSGVAAEVGIIPALVPGYTLTLTNGSAIPTNSAGALILSAALAGGTGTNIVLHLQPGGACPMYSGAVAQLLKPVFSDSCGNGYEDAMLPMITSLTGFPAAVITETFSPTNSLGAYQGTNVTVTATLTYTNMGTSPITQTLVQNYPINAEWGTPTNITGGGVLNTNAGTITWATNVSASGLAVFSFKIAATNACNYGVGNFLLQPATYLDCQGCTEYVDTNSLFDYFYFVGCGGSGGGCGLSASVSAPNKLVEDCASQPFTMVITNFTGTFLGRWTNVAWTASLSSGFAYNSSAVQVFINGTNVTSYLSVSNSGGTLQVQFTNLNNISEFTNFATLTNITLTWDAGVSEIGAVTQTVAFDLCSEAEFDETWSVGTSALSITVTPPFVGFECGYVTIPITLQQQTSPYVDLNTNTAIFPDYTVDVVLNLDPTDDPLALGTGNPLPTLSYVTNSTVLVGIITNAAGNQLILTNVPVVTNNLVIWHLGNLGVFTNGTITCKFQSRCGGAPTEQIQGLVRYDVRCAATQVPQEYGADSSIQLVSDQKASLQGIISPAQITMITTNFTFQAEFENTEAAAAHNFYIEVQAPTNIFFTSATVPWNYVTAVNSGTNAYYWTFTNNAAPLQGLIDDLGDGSFNDLAPSSTFLLSVTGAVSSCGSQLISASAGSGCLGSICEQVGPLTVQLQTLAGQAVAMLVFPTTLPICQTNSLYYDVRNASLSSIYQVTPSFFLPTGLSYIPGSAVATNIAGQGGAVQIMSIPDPASGNGTQANPYTWTPAQVSYLNQLASANDVIIGFKVAVACDSTVSGEGGASAIYYDTCDGFNQAPLELSAGNIGLPVLSLTKTFLTLNDQPKTESIPGETNIFVLTIQHTVQSQATVQGIQLTDFFPTNSFAFLGASIKPDGTNGSQLIWSNSTLMAAIPNQVGGPYYVTSAPISLVITGMTLGSCSSPAVNSAEVDYGCANSLCQSATGSASVAMTPNLQIVGGSESLQLNSCGGTYTATIINNGAPATFVEWTNYAPAGYLISSATVSGALYSPTNATATLMLGGSAPYVGKYAVLNLASTNVTNVRGTTNYNGDLTDLFVAPGQSFTVTFNLISDGSTLDCTVNDYPAAPVPVTLTNNLTFNNFCGSPATAGDTFTALPDQPKPAVDIEPKEFIVTNGQVQNFTVTIENVGTHGNASELEARILFQLGWTNIVINGWTNFASGTTNGFTLETNAQNGVLVNLGGLILAPLQTVVIGVSATATENGNPLNVTAETVGACGSPSPNACTSFSPSSPLALTMPPSPDISQMTNNTIYGFYQDYADGTGFSLAKTVRYSTESAAAAGTNRVARIGENLIYRITATYFDAPFTNVIVNDSLPPNLVYGTPVDEGSSASVLGWTFNPANGNFTLSTVPVTNSALFVVDIPVTVTNGLLNQAGVSFTNTATSTFTTVVTNIPPPVSTVVAEVEPTLYVSTLVSTNTANFASGVTNVQAGDLIYYQIVITNTLGTNAYDLWLSNSLPAGFASPNIVSVVSTGVIMTNGVRAGSVINPALLNFTNGLTLNVGTNEVDVYTNSSLTIVISANPGYTFIPGQITADSSTIQWSSLPGSAPQERTGTGLIPLPGVNDSINNSILNNYADTSIAVATVDTSSVLFSKVLVGTDHAAPGNGLTNAVIGENVFYKLSVTVPQGTTPSLVITDTLPYNLAFVGVTNVTWSLQVTNSQPVTVATNPANTVVTANGQTVVFNLGNVTNLNSNDQLTNGLTLTFQAVVLDILTNRAGTNFLNNASFTWGTASPTTTNVSSAGVLVVEPQLQITELVATNTTPTSGIPGLFSPSVSSLQASDKIYYQITITNAAGVNNTTAYNLYVSNSLPAGLINPTIYSVTAYTNYGNVYSNGVPQIGALSSSLFGINPVNNVLTNVSSAELDLATNAAIVLVVSAQLSPVINPAIVLIDTNTIEWASLPGVQTNLSAYNPAGNSRTGVSTPLPAAGVNNYGNNTLLDNYAAAAGVTATLISPTFTKVLAGRDHTASGLTATNVVIGEHVNYTLTLTVPQGVISGAQMVDTLPTNLAFVTITNITWSAGVSNSNPITVGSNQTYVTFANGNSQVTFNLGNVTNANTGDTAASMAITFQTVVLDTNINRYGTPITNSALFTSGQYNPSAVSSAVVTVMEPALRVTELVATNNSAGKYGPTVSSVQANDTIYYQITITNVGAAYTNTVAYDLYMSNSLPAGLVSPTIVSVTAYTNNGNVYSNGLPQIGTLSTSLFGINPVNNVLTNVPNVELDLEPTSSIIVVVSAQLSPTINSATVLVDTNTIEWGSLPNILSNGTVLNQTNLSAYNPFGNERLGVGTPLPAAGVDNFTQNGGVGAGITDNYAAASATATATVISPGFTKAFVSTSLTNPGNVNTNVVIGELATYTLTLAVPQGVTAGASIVDTLPTNLAFVGVTGVAWSAGVSNSTPITVATNPANTTVANNGSLVTFSLGTVTNANTGDLSNGMAITFQAVVLDTNTCRAGAFITNSAQFVSAQYTSPVVYSGTVKVAEPQMQVTELVATNLSGVPGQFAATALTSVQASDTIYYELLITNKAGANNTTAYDLIVSNNLPAALVNPQVYSVTALGPGNVYSNSVPVSGALSPNVFNFAGNFLSVSNGMEIDLDTNGAIVVVVSAQLNSTNYPGSPAMTDSTTIQWTSLPGVQTNLSVYSPFSNERTGVGTPQPAVGVNNYGMNAILDNYADASAAVSVTSATPVFTKVLVGTDHAAPGNGASQVVIGERVNYQLTLQMPQGVLIGAKITDTLPKGLAYIGVTNASWSLGVSNSTPVAVATNQAGVLSFTANKGNQVVVLSLGNVTNANTGDGTAYLSVIIQAVVQDTNLNVAGDSLINSAKFSSTPYTSASVSDTGVTIVEPQLQISELVATNSPSLANTPSTFLSSVATVQANDTIYYQIVITNAAGPNNTTAYNLYVSNSLPAGLLHPAIYSVTAYTNYGNVYSNGIPQTGILSNSIFGINPVNNVLTNLPTVQLALDTNAAIVLVVSGQLSPTVNPAMTLIDTNTIEWQSLPGPQTNQSAYGLASYLRSGTNTPPPAPGVNNYGNATILGNNQSDYYSAAASAVTAMVINPSFVKTLTGVDHTEAGLTGTNVVIGERVFYTLTFTAPQGVTPGVQVVDTLPQGLGFAGVTNLTWSLGVSNSLPVLIQTNNQANVTVSGASGKTVTFNLGNVTNVNSGDGIATMSIEFATVVLDTNASRAGVAFTNIAYCTSSGGYNSGVSTSAVVSVTEPVLQVSELVATNLAGVPGVYGPGASSLQANDKIYYQITITNVGSGYTNCTAYNLYVSNALPVGLVSPSVVSVTAYTNNGGVYSNTLPQTGTLSTSLFGFNAGNVLTNTTAVELDLDPTSAIVVVVSAQLSSTINAGMVLIDTNTIEWASLPGVQTNLCTAGGSFGNSRTGVSTPLPAAGVNNFTQNGGIGTGLLDNYAAAAAVTATVINPSFTKVLAGTDHTASGLTATNVVIGEHVNYTLTLTVPQGVITGAQMVDTLPTNLAFVTITNITWSSGVSNSNPITVGSNQTYVTFANGNSQVTFNLGNVTNAGTGDGTASMAITFQTVVLDTNINRYGTPITNSAVFTSGQYNSPAVSSAVVTVAEPALQVIELAGTNTTSPFTSSVSSVQVNDTIYYQITITNVGTAYTNTTAYDLYVSNSLPAGLVNPAVISVTAYTNNGNVYSNGLPQIGTLSPGLFGINPANNVLTNVPNVELDLEPTSSIVVVVSAQLSYVNNLLTTVNDTTTIEWASLPNILANGTVLNQTNLSAYNPFGNERLGVGAALPAAGVDNFTQHGGVGTGITDNYAAAAAVATVTTTPTSLVFAKVLVGTDHTAPGNGATNVVIGEHVTYQLTLSVPQGVTTNAVMVDTLPTNLAFVGVTGVSWSANVTNSRPITIATNPANTTVANNGNQVTFNLGNVTNINTGDVTTNGLTITFQTVVLDVLTNQAGTNFINTATFTSGAYNLSSNSGPVLVVEPTLQVGEQVSVNPTNSFGPSVSTLQAGDTVYYQMVITNSAGLNGTTAYDLWLSNSLPSGLLNPYVYSVTNAGPGNVYTNGLTGTNGLGTSLFSFAGSLLTVAPGNEIDLDTNGAIVIVVAAQLSYTNNLVATLSDNTAIAWASLPGVQTNLSAYNSSANERTALSVTFASLSYATNYSTNSALLDNYAALAPVAAVTTAPTSLVFAKVLVGTDHTAPGNGATNVVIGEHVTYQLTLSVPQGVTTNAVMVDTLPTNLAFVGVTGVSWSANVTNSRPITIATNPVNTTVANNGNQVTFNLGNVTNINTGDATTNGLTITFQTVVLDVLTNQAGTNFINTATFTSGAYNLSSNSGPVLVVEPTLQVGEQVSVNPTNSFGPSVSTLQAGDTVYYQMVITNSAGLNGTTAYDLWLSNSLPSGLLNPYVYSVTNAGPGNVYTNGLTGTNGLGTSLFSFAGSLLTVAPGNEIDLDTNGAIVIVVAAQLSYTNNLVATLSDNTAIAWASLPGVQTNLSAYNSSANERTALSVTFASLSYATNYSTNSALLDNYAALAPVAAVTTAPTSLVFAKVLVGTDHTAPGNGATNVVIGEHVTYQLTLSVPQGVTTNAVLVDTLPTNLAFVGVTGVSWSANVTNSRPITIATNPANTTVANNGNQVTFNLGNVTNINTGDATTNGLTITFQTVVLDMFTNRAGTNFINTATFTSGAYNLSSNSGPVLVVEPVLQVSEQVSSANANYGSFTVSSNTVYYQLVITNSAGLYGTTAYDLFVSNSLPVGLINPMVYSVTNLGTGNIYTNGLTGTNGLSTSLFAFTNLSGTNVLVVAPGNEIDLDTNGAIVIVITAQVAGVLNPMVPLTDNTTIEWSSLPGTQTNLSAYNSAANERTGVSTPLPAPGVNNSSNNALLDNYAAASGAALDYIPASIGNYVWNDNNADGVRQTAEPGIPGVVVFLDLNHTGQYATNDPSAMTDANGYYLITNLVGGTYSVAVVTNDLPSGAHETYSLVGGTNAPQEIVSVVLTNGTTRLDANFGYDYTSYTLATLKAGSFKGVATNGGVLLKWVTLSEADTAYYNVNRLTGNGWESVVPFVFAQDSATGASYSALDSTASAPGTYEYELVEWDLDGSAIPLGYCSVVIGSPSSVGSPIFMTIQLQGGNILLQWTGGTSPYYLEQCTGLGQTNSSSAVANVVGTNPGTAPASGWLEVPLPDNTTNSVLLPISEPAGFFRVRTDQ